MDSADKLTKRKVVEIKYNNLIKKLVLLPFLKEVPLPSLDKIEITETLFYLKLLLTNSDNEYRDNLKNLLVMKKIKLENEEQFEEFHKIVFPFIVFIKEFL
jgi:hypothetical protein